MSIRRIGSGTIWELGVGYSRAILADGFLINSSSAALDDAGNVVGSNMYEARYILQRMGEMLRDAGSGLYRVVQTLPYVNDASWWEEVGRAHHEVFGDDPPATSFIHVKPFVHPDMLVEIELTAIMHANSSAVIKAASSSGFNKPTQYPPFTAAQALPNFGPSFSEPAVILRVLLAFALHHGPSHRDKG